MWTPNKKGTTSRRLEIKVRLGYIRPYLKKKYQRGIYTPMVSAAFSSSPTLARRGWGKNKGEHCKPISLALDTY